jgi:hypothetical protein
MNSSTIWRPNDVQQTRPSLMENYEKTECYHELLGRGKTVVRL